MSATIDIRSDFLEIVKTILRTNAPREARILVFGSRATWKAKEFSDLDLALSLPDGAPIADSVLTNLRDAFEVSDLPWKVDILDLNAIAPDFKAAIKADCVPLNIEEEWEEMKLENLIKFSNGKRSPKNTGKYSVYGGNGILGKCDVTNYNGKTIIIGRVGAYCGATYYEKQPIWVSDNAIAGKSKNNNNSKYCFYLLKNININNYAIGSSQPLITQAILNSIIVNTPKPAEQKAIADILSSLDDKIDLNQQMCETLEKTAARLFKSWFVDFDVVKAKATLAGNGVFANWDSQRAKSYLSKMDSAITTLFPDNFKPSPLGDIPAGWVVNELSEEFNLLMGQSPSGDTYNAKNIGIPFFQGIRDFGFRYPKNRVFCTSPTRLANDTATLVSVRAPVGEINMAMGKICIGRGVASVQHKLGFSSYTYYYMRSLKEKFKMFESEGTVFGSINKTAFSKMKILHSKSDILKSFEEICSPIDESIKISTMQTQALTKTRDALLPKLISGKLQVKESS